MQLNRTLVEISSFLIPFCVEVVSSHFLFIIVALFYHHHHFLLLLIACYHYFTCCCFHQYHFIIIPFAISIITATFLTPNSDTIRTVFG